MMPQHPTRTLLQQQRVDLSLAIREAESACVPARLGINLAKRYLRKIEGALKDTDFGLDASAGLYGPNGWGPGIADVLGSLRRHTAYELERTAKVNAPAAVRMEADMRRMVA